MFQQRRVFRFLQQKTDTQLVVDLHGTAVTHRTPGFLTIWSYGITNVEKHFLGLLILNDLFDCFNPRPFFPPRLSRFIDDLKLDRRTQRDDRAEIDLGESSWRNAAPAPVICHVCWRNLLLHGSADNTQPNTPSLGVLQSHVWAVADEGLM